MEWTHIKDKKPSEETTVIVKLENDTVTCGYVSNGEWMPVGVCGSYDIDPEFESPVEYWISVHSLLCEIKNTKDHEISRKKT